VLAGIDWSCVPGFAWCNGTTAAVPGCPPVVVVGAGSEADVGAVVEFVVVTVVGAVDVKGDAGVSERGIPPGWGAAPGVRAPGAPGVATVAAGAAERLAELPGLALEPALELDEDCATTDVADRAMTTKATFNCESMGVPLFLINPAHRLQFRMAEALSGERSTVARPQRVQLKRTKGWRMPPDTVKVDRTTEWGNPFRPGENGVVDAADAVVRFRNALACDRARRRRIREVLRGKNLACWCKPEAPCHADVLLEIAN
jgi:hypothetical protein